MDSPFTCRQLSLPSPSPPSDLSAFLTSLDSNPFPCILGDNEGLPTSLASCDASPHDVDPFFLYINDLLMAEESRIPQPSSPQGAHPCTKVLNDYMEDIPGEDFSAEDFFAHVSAMEDLVRAPLPRISDGSQSRKDELESWINEVLSVPTQSGECFVSSPRRSSPMSETLSQLNHLHDSSLQTIDDIFESERTNSISDLEELFPVSDNALECTITDAISDVEEGFPVLDDQALQRYFCDSTGDDTEANRSQDRDAARDDAKAAGICMGCYREGDANARNAEDAGEGHGCRGSEGRLGGADESNAGEEGESGEAGKAGLREAMVAVQESEAVEEKNKGDQEAIPAALVGKEGTKKKKRGEGRGRQRGGGTRRRTRASLWQRAAPVVVVDLRNLLVTCAQMVASYDNRSANQMLRDIWRHASPLGNGLQRLSYYFAEGLVARLSGTGGLILNSRLLGGGAGSSSGGSGGGVDAQKEAARILRAYHTYVAVCPFLKLSHFFANEAILAAASGADRLHIVDFNILYGFQWPCFIKALAERPGGPPALRITGIEIPRCASAAPSAERLEETGRRLAHYAHLYGVPFEYNSLARRWEAVSAASLRLRPGETLMVNCIYRLRHLMDETMVTPPASPREAVLALIRRLNPKLFVEGVVNAAYNAPFFLSRFREALFHYSSIFDALDTTIRSDLEERLVIERDIMGREILNVVACEGLDRLERPETYRKWQLRTQSAGFEVLPIDPLIKTKAQAIARGFYHKDYGVEDDEQGRWLLLGWKGRMLHGISSWRPSPSFAAC